MSHPLKTAEFHTTASKMQQNATSTRDLMLDVIIALLPALAAAVYAFGLRSLAVCSFTVVCCVVFEWLYTKIILKHTSIYDLSAIVTGMLLACALPSTVPYWICAVGAFFAIIVVKQWFGGLGKNFLNPALSACAFLMAFPNIMTTYAAPNTYRSIFNIIGASAYTGESPLSFMRQGILPDNISILQTFLGEVTGTIGGICALALLLGGLYLVVRRVISPYIPLAFLATAALLAFLFPRGNDPLSWMLFQLFSGNLMLASIFMATDPVTSPVTKSGQLIFGIGCGILTMVLRYFGTYEEGVVHGILLMNLFCWTINHVTIPYRWTRYLH